MRLGLARLSSPLGTMLVSFDGEGRLRTLDFETHESRMHALLARQNGPCELVAAAAPAEIARAMEAYFAGEVGAIDTLPVATGGTGFQREVWAALRGIPAGTTTSYGALAAKLGKPGASRAVGLANGANPIGIVVPCHRVIGADGTLTGYGGGLPRKQWLLAHEGALPSPVQPTLFDFPALSQNEIRRSS